MKQILQNLKTGATEIVDVPIRRLFQLLYQAVTAAKRKNVNFQDLTPIILIPKMI